MPTEATNCLHRHYGDSAPDRSMVSRWMARFAAGREVLEDDPRVVGSVTVTMEDNVVHVCALLDEDQHLTFDKMKASIGISCGSLE